jgi:hypothetical protein
MKIRVYGNVAAVTVPVWFGCAGSGCEVVKITRGAPLVPPIGERRIYGSGASPQAGANLRSDPVQADRDTNPILSAVQRSDMLVLICVHRSLSLVAA